MGYALQRVDGPSARTPLHIAGAVSRPVLAMVAGYGIRVVPYATGEPEAVIQAWAQGRPKSDMFSMSGCLQIRHQQQSEKSSQ